MLIKKYISLPFISYSQPKTSLSYSYWILCNHISYLLCGDPILLVYTDLILAYILVLYIVLFYLHHFIAWYMFDNIILPYNIFVIYSSICN